jgi:hypothetical protein
MDTNKNPFEIRLELLRMAKDMLCDAYYAERDVIMREYDAHLSQGRIAAKPILPEYPSEAKIIEKATLLNAFISGK